MFYSRNKRAASFVDTPQHMKQAGGSRKIVEKWEHPRPPGCGQDEVFTNVLLKVKRPGCFF
jgi:hypothetical protein